MLADVGLEPPTHVAESVTKALVSGVPIGPKQVTFRPAERAQYARRGSHKARSVRIASRLGSADGVPLQGHPRPFRWQAAANESVPQQPAAAIDFRLDRAAKPRIKPNAA